MGAGMNRQSRISGQKTALCDTIMVDPCPHTSVQTQRRCTTKSDPDVSSGRRVVMTRLCRFNNYNKCALWWEILMMGETAGSGAEGIWRISVSSPRLCCELKTALKNTLF